MANHQNEIKSAVHQLLQALGEDTHREGLRDTPARVASAWLELCRGYQEFPHKVTLFPSKFSGIIFRPGIPFSSTCEHHLLPYSGTIDFAYIPSGKVIGISKIIRLFRHFSARLSIQEDLTELLINTFTEIVEPKGCAIRISATHTCESSRGVTQSGVPTVTTIFTGIFFHDTKFADNFLAMLPK